jgi:DNA-binding transcriptional LysR family regulator
MRWMDRIGRRLKLRDLHILMAVAQRGSMAKAARDLAISQPVVSKTIADLERAIGVSLLDRTRHGVEPTQYGRALLKHGVAIFDELKQSVREIEFLADPTIGELRVGCSESISSGILPPVVHRFSQQYPRVILEMGPGDTDAMLRELRDRSLDLILVRTGEDFLADHFTEDLNFEVLLNDESAVVVGLESRWARRRKIDLAELVNERWILAAPDTENHKLVAEAFRARGLAMPNVSMNTLSVHLRTYLLATGQFITVFPRSILRLYGDRFSLKVLPIDLPVRPWLVAIVTLKNRTLSPVVERFIECAREVMMTLEKAKKPR